MKKTLCLATAVLTCAMLLPLANTAHAAPPSNLPKPCTAGEGSLSVNGSASNLSNISYSSQPVFQNTQSRLGTTPEEIQTNFANVIESNFRSGSAEHILNNLSERELQDLAKFYATSSQGKEQPLLKIFAQDLSDQGLVRVAKVFGTIAVGEAVNSYSNPNIQIAYDNKIAALSAIALPLSTSEPVRPLSVPTLDMTIPEIYLEFRTAPIGSVGPTAAIAETSMFVAKNVTIAASAGWAIGTGISNLIQTYDPSLDDAIGGTVAGMVDQANQSWNQFAQGQYQASFDALFGSPVSNSGNPSGDFGEFQALDYYLGCSP